MSNFKYYLENKKIYNNIELENFIKSLENRFMIVDSFEHYNSLVNFSKNKDVPIHEWFKYREGFSGALIDELIDDSNLTSNDIIVDPFVGSGTTLVSAVQKGYDCIGIDVNPMSALLSKVKSTFYSAEDLELTLDYLIKLEQDFNSIRFNKIEHVSKYFNEKNYIDLNKIFSFINTIENKNVFEIMFCSYLSIIEECSNRKRDGNGLKISITKIDDVLKFYNKKVKQIINDIKLILYKFTAKSYVFADTATNLSLYCEEVQSKTNKNIGSIIFSPPYANSFDYFESYKLELWMGGFLKNNKTLNDYRNIAIRSFIGCEKETAPDHFIELLANEIQETIPLKEKETGKKDCRTRKVPQMIMGYFKDMEKVILECYTSLRKNGKCYIVVDQSSYLGKVVPSDLLIAYLAEKIGFTVDRIIECRNAKTSSQQIQKYPYLKTMLRESIVVLQK